LLHILGTLDSPDEGYIVANGVRIEYQRPISLVPVSAWKRLLNSILDTSLAVAPLRFTGLVSTEIMNVDSWWLDLLYSLAAVSLYYFVMETVLGTTIGKFITGCKVITEEGLKPDIGDCLIRTVCRLIPFEWVSFLSRRPIGWHDSISGTVVVDRKVPY